MEARRKSPRCKLRILTQNLWHGLDHTRPYVMWPKENPLTRVLRLQAQKAALKGLLEPEDSTGHLLEVFCLQELNPVDRKLKDFKKSFGMEGHGCAVNVGVRAGSLSYPLFLQEGLGIFWKGDLRGVRCETQILSGYATELMAPFQIPLTFQLAERRGAMLVTGQWNGKTFTFANLHLHNGSPESREVGTRRAREIDILMEWLDPYVQQSDAAFIAGDFNCEHGNAELSPLFAAGFEEILTARGEPIVTWDPELNLIAKNSIEDARDPLEREWDKRRHQIDHIFYKVKGKSWGKREDSRPPWTFKIERVLDQPVFGAWPSDHYGLMAEISWTLPEPKAEPKTDGTEKKLPQST